MFRRRAAICFADALLGQIGFTTNLGGKQTARELTLEFQVVYLLVGNCPLLLGVQRAGLFA